MPIQTATTSRLSPPVTRTLRPSGSGSTVPTAGLIRSRTSSAGASMTIRAWTAQPVRATSRTTNSVRSPGNSTGVKPRPPGVRRVSQSTRYGAQAAVAGSRPDDVPPPLPAHQPVGLELDPLVVPANP